MIYDANTDGFRCIKSFSNMGSSQSHIIGFDFEGAATREGYNAFNPYHVAPLQLGAYSMTTNRRFSAIFRTDPSVPLTEWHRRETPHLTREALNSGEEPCAAMMRFLTFVEAHPGKKVLVGYGSETYDRPLLMRLLNECKLKLSNDVTFADARDNFLRIYPGTPSGMKSGKLAHVCKYYKIDFEGKAHDAATDAEMTAKLYEELSAST